VNFSKDTLAVHLNYHKYAYILLLLIILLNIPVWAGLIYDWLHDDNYSHGFLILPVSIYLFYRQKRELVFPARPSRTGILIFAAGCLGLILGTAAGELFTTRLAVVLTITGLGLHYLGTDNFKKIWFAFFFLIFMIPIPAIIYHSATLPMQLFASKATIFILHLIGVPSLRQGNIIYLPQYTLEVTEACSGLRSLATLLALAALYGNLTLRGWVRPLALFIAAVPIAIIANIFRLLTTAIGAYAISTSLAEDFLHELSGLLVFFSALIIIVILGAILRWPKKRS